MEKISELSLLDKVKSFLGAGKDADGIIYDGNRLVACKNKKLKDYTVKEGTQTICDGAFARAKNLQSLTLPASIINVGDSSLPRTLKNIVFKGGEIKHFYRHRFYIPENAKVRDIKGLTIYGYYRFLNELSERFKSDKVSFKSLNSREPVDLGTNGKGEKYTTATVRLSIKGTTKAIEIDDKHNMMIASHAVPVKIEVENPDGRIVFSDENFIIDGNINAAKSNHRFSSQTHDYWMVPRSKKAESESFINSAIYNIFSEKIKNIDDKFVTDIKVYESSTPSILTFKIDVADGLFDSSKLDFVFYNDSEKQPRGKLPSFYGSNDFVLNLICYDGEIYEAEKTVFDSQSKLIATVNLQFANDLIPGTYIYSKNVFEAMKENEEDESKGSFWYSIGKDATVAPIDYNPEDLKVYQHNDTGQYGFLLITNKSQLELDALTLGMINGAVSADKLRSVDERILKSSKWVLYPTFDDAEDFSEGLAAVKVDSKWGFIDKKGTMIIKPTYGSVEQFSKGYSIVEKKNKKGVIDITGKEIVPLVYDEITAKYLGDLDVYLVEKSGKWGILNDKFETLLEPTYAEIGMIDHELKYISVGVVDNSGEIKYGFIDFDFNTVIEPKFQEVDYFSEGFAAVKLYDKWGFIDTKGNYLRRPTFDEASAFKNGRAPIGVYKVWKDVMANVFKKDIVDAIEWGFIDTKGYEVIKPKYYEVKKDYDQEGYAMVCKSEKDFDKDVYYFIDMDGKEYKQHP